MKVPFIYVSWNWRSFLFGIAHYSGSFETWIHIGFLNVQMVWDD